MNLNKNYIKRKIYLEKDMPVISTKSNKDVYERETFNRKRDYYINIFLTKTCELFEYVDVKRDEKVFKIDKQTINPFYIDFDFFSSVKRIKINNKNDLTSEMIIYLNQNYANSIKNYSDVYSWFDEIGYNILINEITTTVNDVTGKKQEENGLDKLEKIEKNSHSIVSKSFYFPISINK
jgi:hypothetical protein